MKVLTANNLAGILSGIKLNKIEDKVTKGILLKDFLALRKVAKEAAEDREEIVKKFQDDWRDELKAVDALRKEGKAVTGHDEYLDAEKDANRAISDIFDAEVEVVLVSASLDAIPGISDEISFEQIALLQENGVIE